MPKISRHKALELVSGAVRMNGFERAIAAVAPGVALRRARDRAALALTGSYVGGSRTRKSTSEWITSSGDADADLLWDLPKLIDRSRDLERNDPMAHGALLTKGINIIGPGLKYRPQIDREYLGMYEEEADALENQAKREWRLFWSNHEVDVSRICQGPELEWQGYKQCKVNGSSLVLFRRVERSGSPYATKIHLIEADRLCNKDRAMDSESLSSGVRKNPDTGEPVEYHILKSHPGSMVAGKKYDWDVIPAYGKTGLRNILHIFRQDRPGQSTGIPDLAPVIESLKQIGRYTEAELEAAVLQAFFTVFVKNTNPDAETGSPITPNSALGIGTGTGSDEERSKVRLGKGMVVGLDPMEEIQLASPSRPNANYDPFFQSVAQLIGVALGIPHQIILKRFDASYTAARAAMLEFWKYCIFEREWWALRFNQGILEVFWYEAVTLGRLNAPGFFDDPLARMAYLGSDWIGPAKGMVDETKEIQAAKERISLTLTTHDEETAQLTGGDWEAKQPQLAKETALKKKNGLDAEQNKADAEAEKAAKAEEENRRQSQEQEDEDEREQREEEERRREDEARQEFRHRESINATQALAAAIKEQPAPVVNVAPAQVTVEAPQVTVAPPSITVEAPQVTVTQPEIKTDLHLHQAKKDGKASFEIVRDKDGRPSGIKEKE